MSKIDPQIIFNFNSDLYANCFLYLEDIYWYPYLDQYGMSMQEALEYEEGAEI